MCAQATFEGLAPFCLARPSQATLSAADKIYRKLLAEGRFLPPSLVLDVLSVLQGGGRGVTPPGFLRRESSEGWRQFLDTLSRRGLSVRGPDPSHPPRVLAAISDNLMARRPAGWTAEAEATVIQEGPARLVAAEQKGLQSAATTSLPWAALAKHLNAMVMTEGGREELVPFSASFRHSSTSAGSAPIPRFDSQLDVLIKPVDRYRDQSELVATTVSRGPDSGPERHYAGDFLERAPGPLPANLADISPADLVLVAPVPAASARLRRALKLRFALKAGEGDINQRYHAQQVPGVKGRRLSVRIRMVDSEKARDRVNRVNGFHAVSLYRAAAVFFLHHLARHLSRPHPPECSVVLELSNGDRQLTSRALPRGFHEEAAISPRRCAEVIWASLPAFFSVEHPRISSVAARARDETADLSVDLLLGARGRLSTSSASDGFLVDVMADPLTGKVIPRVLSTPGIGGATLVGNCDAGEAYILGQELVGLISGGQSS